jgi:hypothetical protein
VDGADAERTQSSFSPRARGVAAGLEARVGNLYASLHGGFQNCECCRGGCVPPTPLPGRGFDPQSGGGRNPPFLTTHTFYGKTIKSMVHMSNRRVSPSTF